MEGSLFVGQIWFKQPDDRHKDGSKYVVCHILRPEKGVVRPHLRCSVLSLNYDCGGLAGYGIRLNGIHSETTLRADGYLPKGFMHPFGVKALEDAKKTNKLPQHVIDAWKDKRARDWAAMQAEQGVDVQLDVTKMEVAARCAETHDSAIREKSWAKAKAVRPDMVHTTDERLEKITGIKQPKLSHRRN